MSGKGVRFAIREWFLKDFEWCRGKILILEWFLKCFEWYGGKILVLKSGF